MCVHITAHMPIMSENNLQELFLSFCHVCPENQSQLLGLGSKYFNSLSYFAVGLLKLVCELTDYIICLLVPEFMDLPFNLGTIVEFYLTSSKVVLRYFFPFLFPLR